MFRFLVLGLLRDGVPRHGYALMKEYTQRSGLRISTGNFYRELQRLLALRLVSVTDNPPDADPRRAPYAITAAGIAALDAWLAGTTHAPATYHDELGVRLVLLGHADAAANQALAQWREELWMLSKTIEHIRNAPRPPENESAHNGTRTLVLTRRLKHIAVDLEFIDALRAAGAKN